MYSLQSVNRRHPYCFNEIGKLPLRPELLRCDVCGQLHTCEAFLEGRSRPVCVGRGAAQDCISKELPVMLMLWVPAWLSG